MLRIKIVGLADGRESPIDGQFLIRCDVNARSGRGHIVATKDPEKARVFLDVAEAHEYWARQSTLVPLRPDGKPNRPLTAYSVVIEKWEGRE